jgi:uncharacterized protein (DUF934 family)
MRFIAPETARPQGTLVLDSTQDVTRMSAELAGRSEVWLHFTKWTDGRGYSQAVLLRARLRYKGDIIATGDVLADMLPMLRRCGFSAVQLRADQSVEAAHRALGFFDGGFDDHYQRSTLAPALAAA